MSRADEGVRTRRAGQTWLAARAIFMLALACCGSAAALEAPRKVVDYDIQVALEPDRRLFTGHEVLRWTNPSDRPVSTLKFHLYWNAFRNSSSTFSRESGGHLRSDRADRKEGWGFIDVTSMSWGATDLLKGARFESPDDGNADDRTVLSVPLPRPAEPGETVALEIGWKAMAPRVFARAGHVRDFYMVGQWYPKIAVLEPRERRRRAEPGWNTHQYHAFSEFYADWGDYRVAITVPERFVVASAGAKVSETRKDGRKTLVFVQERIHDFAWSADPRYIVRESQFDPSRDTPASELDRASKILGLTRGELLRGLRPVQLRFYMQPGHESQWRRYEDAQKWALAWLGLWAFPYPYEQVSVIDPPEDGMGAAGMEYQTLYTAGTDRRLSWWPLQGLRFQEGVVIHEFAHGYWYGLLASNEFEESWMDEGITTFAETVMMGRRYRYSMELPFGVGISDEDQNRAEAMGTDLDPIRRNAWGFASERSYGKNSYARPATVLHQIRRLAGEEAFWRAFRSYALRWRFDHPTAEDFFDAFRPLAIPGFDSLLAGSFSGTSFVDFRIVTATSEKQTPPAGYDDRGRLVLPPDEKSKGKGEEKGPFETEVVVGRDGDLVLPVEIALTFENGQVARTRWDGREKWIRLRTVYVSRLTRAEVDPTGTIVLDRDPFNNVKVLHAKGLSAAAKVRTYAMHFVENLLSLVWSLP
jgi:hypothetical protein